MVTSWKTSLLGLALIAIGVIGMGVGAVDKTTGSAIVVAGLGLLAAKDHNVTGGTRQQ